MDVRELKKNLRNAEGDSPQCGEMSAKLTEGTGAS